jgi:sarcosine oxidase subunit alpha
VAEQTARIPGGGRLDHADQRRFTFDGETVAALAGDTVASALLANGVHLAGRSFKLHRPRGIFSAGVEEPTALVTLRTGGRTEPNIPAPLAEVHDGLQARSQNRWPSLRFDLMAVNNAAARFLPAGFYYKTFMGPTRGSWMYYEPAIRRAAGLGRGTTEPDPDRYEHRNAFCDLLVVGGGPAGLTAALAAGRAGARVVLVEQMPVPGGGLLSEPVDSAADRWRRATIEELAGLENVELLHRTTAFGLYDGDVVGAVERCYDHVAEPPPDQPRQRMWTIHTRRIVLATGATERPLLFGDNDRPGVMLAESVRRYINHYGVLPGQRVVVFTNNDSAYATALDLKHAGAGVTVVDTRTADASAVAATAIAEGLSVWPGARIDSTRGRRRVRGVRIHDGHGVNELACDLVCVAGGWTPNVHLASHRGTRPEYREALGAFVPGELPANQVAVGSMAGTLDIDTAITEAWAAGRAAAGARPESAPAAPAVAMAPGWTRNMKPAKPTRGKVFVDLQNDVSDGDVALAWREGYRSVEHLKRYTTLGMGTDQGRTSNINGLTLMAGLRGEDIPTTGTTTFRPPYTPVALGALVGRRTGRHFRPERRTPMHDRHVANDVVFTPAGPWQRPRYYRAHGADVETAYVREMEAVRGNVGMTDVSTLGKIDVQGPDAPEFLNRVYVNAWLRLPIGKARYGVMLRDDGFALDDGTTSHIAENHYFMTTTTGEAAEVMSWLEYLLETAWPDLRVQVTSVTDQWAGIAVAGPNSQRVLGQALPGVDIADASLPPMGVTEATTDDGLPVRVLRVSFSGERAYEVYTPAGYGDALWETVERAGQPLGIVAYGLEALGALRIEKGHPVAAEIDGRTTLDDLGLGGIARTNKRFIGDVLRQRPALTAPDRRRMVGLRAEDPDAVLRAGTLVFETDAPAEGHGIGHVTSATWSPELGCHIALAFIERGPEREGAVVSAVSPIHGEHVAARVVSTVFLDPEGERIHA